MISFDGLLEGLASAMTLEAILFVSIGTVIGILVGAAPGLGNTVGMAMMIPVAIRLSPELAIFLFVAISTGANYGNSIPAILVRVPGTPAALLRVVEGNPFHERGEGRRALSISLIASVVGQMIGNIAFVLLVVPLAGFAVRLLFPEIFAIVLFGLAAGVGMVTARPLKGFIAIALGLALALPGPDPLTGSQRLTFGLTQLSVGLPVIPIVVGLLAFRQVFAGVNETPHAVGDTGRASWFRGSWFPREDWRVIAVPITLGSVVGVFVGAIPGAGTAVAAFVGYQIVKFAYPNDPMMGKGSLRGLSGSDAADNASNGGELIPTMGLGIPGSPAMIVLMAALSAQGLIVGPQLMEQRPELVYATFGGLITSTVILLLLGALTIGPSVYISKISPSATLAVTLVLVVSGIYALRWSLFDVWIALAAGAVGYILTKYEYPIAPMALAFILGTLLESSLRRGLVMTGGWEGFLTRPVTAVLLLLAVGTTVGAITLNRRASRREVTRLIAEDSGG